MLTFARNIYCLGRFNDYVILRAFQSKQNNTVLLCVNNEIGYSENTAYNKRIHSAKVLPKPDTISKIAAM
jgi:hypothetical protein